LIVAVVDSGIDATHPDLQGSIQGCRSFVPNEDDRDYVGYGTHVAGIIAAGLNNRIGIAGICRARVLAVKGLPREPTL
jgi:thermitase